MRLSNVTFRYRRRAPLVIHDADAHLAPGDVIELTGVNGAGKSTLLRLLAGLARPSTGTITGRPPVVGFAPDRFPSSQPFNVATYLRHMSRVRGGARWEPWAERLNMGHLLGTRLADLSKGSAHKVGLAQALMADPGLLILDEPFAGLDADTREVLPAIATEVAARGGIVIASDHQGGLRGLPGLRHWSMVDGRLKESTTTPLTTPPEPTPPTPALAPSTTAAPPRTTAPPAEPTKPETSSAAQTTVPDASSAPQATVAVTLPADELPRFLARMRDEGYQAREIDAGNHRPRTTGDQPYKTETHRTHTAEDRACKTRRTQATEDRTSEAETRDEDRRARTTEVTG
ncbi:ABC transporter ATP-binding protein [Nonomuraea candida]|uniref:ABC transporter ATP-binding protein n=1 Tax=Nonomuraea candida TaxID=359159 RepID=UPI000A05E3EC|nr:ATP-binding cassette domain-containing protein [Nonomuraea candida]